MLQPPSLSSFAPKTLKLKGSILRLPVLLRYCHHCYPDKEVGHLSPTFRLDEVSLRRVDFNRKLVRHSSRLGVSARVLEEVSDIDIGTDRT